MADANKFLNKAIPLYIGYGLTSFPKEDGSRLVSEFGSDIGLQLESQVKSLLDELNQLKPDWNNHSLVSASKWASDIMKSKHPELDEKAVASLEWIFSWWWK